MKYKWISLTEKLTLMLLLPSFLIAGLGFSLLENHLINPEWEYTFQGVIIMVTSFLWGCCGMMWTIRKEVPQLITLRGKSAVFTGLFFTIVSWGEGIYALYLTVTHLLS